MKKKDFAYLTLLVAFGLIIQLPAVFIFYYHPDEIMHTFIAHGSTFHEVWNRGLYELHPPGSHLIRHLLLLVSDSIEVNRLLSVIPGLLSILLAYEIGRLVWNRSIGLIIATFQLYSTISVTYSVSIRNYALFALFVYLALFCLALYAKQFKTKQLAGYIAFSFLACATHFSGFIVTAVSGTILASSCIAKRQYGMLMRYILIHLPHFFVGLIFYTNYFAPGTYGAGWREFLTTQPAIITFREVDIADLLTRFVHLFHQFFIHNLQVACFLLALASYGLIIALYRNKPVGAFIALIIFVQIVLTTFGVYPLAGLRYNYYLFLPIVIAIGFAVVGIQSICTRYLSWQKVEAISLVSILAIGVYGSVAMSYIKENNELPLTKKNYAKGLNYLNKNVADNEPILTNKIGGLYLLYEKSKGEIMYGNAKIKRVEVGDIIAWYQARPHAWEYQYIDWFEEFLANFEEVTKGPQPAKIWFTVIGLTDYSLNTVYGCEAYQPKIRNRLLIDGFLVFSLDYEQFFPMTNEKLRVFHNCFEKTRVPRNASLIQAS